MYKVSANLRIKDTQDPYCSIQSGIDELSINKNNPTDIILARVFVKAVLEKIIKKDSLKDNEAQAILDRFKKEYPLRSIPDFTATSALHEYPSGLI